MNTNSIYIEILDFREKTGLYPAGRYSGATEEQTYDMFYRCQNASNELNDNYFIVDLCTPDGTMIDTVPANEETFRMITGEEPKPTSYYMSQCDDVCTINMANRKKFI
jgi:hypothetical protein